jgi:hypothetical protein
MSEPVTYTLKEGDREVEAIRHIISLLDVLRPAERTRIIEYVRMRCLYPDYDERDQFAKMQVVK